MVTTFVFLSVASGTMINVALPYLGSHFGVAEPTYGWVVNGFILTFGVFSAVHGRLGDVFGVRRLYLAGVVAFALGSLVSAAAPTIELLIAVRILTGIGAAAIPALGVSIVSRLLPPERRGAALGVIMATVGVSATISPFLGGALVQWTSWRTVFVVPALGLLLVPLAASMLPRSLDETSHDAGFDGVGAVLLSLGATALMAATSVASSSLWAAAAVGAGGVGSLALFWTWVHHHPTPFAPPALLREPWFVACVTVGALVNGARFGAVVLVPIVLEATGAAGPLGIGAVLVPGAIALAVLSPVAGRLADRYGAQVATVPGVLGTMVTTAALGWLVDSGPLGLAAGMAASGAAFAFVQPPVLAGLGTTLPASEIGVGNGVYMMVFFLGGAFGVALALAVVAAQPEHAVAWLPGVAAESARYSNAMVALAVGVLPAGVAWRSLPGAPR